MPPADEPGPDSFGLTAHSVCPQFHLLYLQVSLIISLAVGNSDQAEFTTALMCNIMRVNACELTNRIHINKNENIYIVCVQGCCTHHWHPVHSRRHFNDVTELARHMGITKLI